MIKKEIKSFAKRRRKLTPRQQAAMSHCWEDWGVVLGENPIDLQALFGRNAPCVMEIGFGNGDSLWRMAQQNPDKDYLAVEVHEPGIANLFIHLLENEVTNVRVVQHDAVELLREHLLNNTLSAVQIFFPDPWPKKRHHKRRLIQPAFVGLLQQKLVANGLIHCATDWQPYAEHMMEVLTAAQGIKNVGGEQQYADNSECALRPNTKFETRGVRLGHGVWDLVFQKS